jgi:glucosamine--fructose-6-phosphate aminotransferase (isomerizing)
LRFCRHYRRFCLGEQPVVVDAIFEVPASEPELDPILLNIPLQLLAYYVALQRGCDID